MNLLLDFAREQLEQRLPNAFDYAAECLARYGEPAKFLPGERVECACGGYGRVREVLRRPGQVPEYVVAHGSRSRCVSAEARLAERKRS